MEGEDARIFEKLKGFGKNKICRRIKNMKIFRQEKRCMF